MALIVYERLLDAKPALEKEHLIASGGLFRVFDHSSENNLGIILAGCAADPAETALVDTIPTGNVYDKEEEIIPLIEDMIEDMWGGIIAVSDFNGTVTDRLKRLPYPGKNNFAYTDRKDLRWKVEVLNIGTASQALKRAYNRKVY